MPLEEIRYSCVDSTLGRAIIAQSVRGVCAVELCDSITNPSHRISNIFPGAKVVLHANARPSATELAIQALAAGLHLDTISTIPLDLRGTPFQERVWRAIQDVTHGTLISYAQLAVAIGKPQASRAVATACGANRIALLIPCHRVIRSDGELSGYRWGSRRKRQLLELEALSEGPD